MLVFAVMMMMMMMMMIAVRRRMSESVMVLIGVFVATTTQNTRTGTEKMGRVSSSRSIVAYSVFTPSSPTTHTCKCSALYEIHDSSWIKPSLPPHSYVPSSACDSTRYSVPAADFQFLFSKHALMPVWPMVRGRRQCHRVSE